MVIPEHLESEFHRTLLTVQMGEGWLTIEDAEFSGHVITAWNPQSKSISLDENVKANLKLSRLLSELGKDFGLASVKIQKILGGRMDSPSRALQIKRPSSLELHSINWQFSK